MESINWTTGAGSDTRWTTNLHRASVPLALRQQALADSGQEKAANDLRFAGLRLAGVTQELSGILISWHRLDWMQSLRQEGHLPEDAFRLYAACDIDAFHVRMRSALDYLATLAWGAAVDRDKLKKFRSFRTMIEWLVKNPNRRDDLGDLADVVADVSDWFYGIREVRNRMVHEGGFTLVFPVERTIGFTVLQPGPGFPLPDIAVPAEVMYNDNVVDFRKYASAHLCWLVCLAETIVGNLLARWDLEADAGIHSSGGGVDMVNAWVQSF